VAKSKLTLSDGCINVFEFFIALAIVAETEVACALAVVAESATPNIRGR